MKIKFTGKEQTIKFQSLFVILLFAAFLFSSCKGFMNASESSKEINDYIAYANAPFYPINVDYNGGSGVVKSPAGGEVQKKVTDSFTVNFEPSGDYEFLYWKIIDSATKKEFKNGEYLSIESVSDSETTCTLVTAPQEGIKLCLTPVLAERPQIISNTPEMKNEGVYRDSRILLMFDQPMEAGSIYYTQEEYDSLIADKGLSHANFLPKEGTGFEANKYYGYMIGNDEETIVYKNISIVQNNVDKGNLLKYFDPPQFEDKARTRLSIAVKKEAKEEVVNGQTKIVYIPLLPAGTSLLVTIDKNFYCSAGPYNKPVTLRESKKWPYFVNANTDSDAPVISSDVEFEIIDTENAEVSTTQDTLSYINKSKILKFRFAITDMGSGPSKSFILHMKNDSNFDKEFDVNYESVEGAYASCGNVNDEAAAPKQYYTCALDDYLTDDGDYNFNLKFSDNTGNFVESAQYYICLDSKDPVVTTRTVKVCNDPDAGSTNPLTTAIQFDYTCADFDNAKLYYRPAIATTASNWGDWSNVNPVEFVKGNNSSGSKLIKGLAYGQYYEIKVDFYDKAKNVTSYLFKKRTQPEKYKVVTPVVNEQARCIKINEEAFAKGADETVISYQYQGETPYRTVSYTSSNGGIFYIRNIPYAQTYNDIFIESKNSEIVTETCYENHSDKIIEHSCLTTLITHFDTKPKRLRSVLMSDPVTSTGKYVVRFTCRQDGSYYKGGVLYSYAKYDSNGTLGSFTDKIPMAYEQNATSVKTSDLSLDINSKYLFRFEPYYKYSSVAANICDEANRTELEISTTVPGGLSPVATLESVKTSKSTATVEWTRTATDSVDYYKLEWYKKSDFVGEATIDKSQSQFMITGLKSNTSYNVKISCCKNDGSTSDAKECVVTTKNKDSLIKITYDPNATIEEKTISFRYEDLINNADNQIVLKYGTSYDAINTTYWGGAGNVRLTNLTETKTYYFRFYDTNRTTDDESDDIPASVIYAIRPPYKESSKKCRLDKFDYEILNSTENNNVKITWDWQKGSDGWPFASFYVWYKPVNYSSWSKYSTPFSTSLGSSTTSVTLSLTKGRDYDIRFSSIQNNFNPDSNKYFASGFVHVPSDDGKSFSPSYDSYATTANSVKLYWSSVNNSYCDWYDVYDVTSGTPVLVADYIEKSTSHEVTITGLTPNSTYKFTCVPHRVGVDDSINVSSYTSVTTKPSSSSNKPPKVTNLQTSGTINTTSCNITWAKPGDDYNKYLVKYWNVSAGESISSSGKLATTNSYDLNDLLPGSEYQVQVSTLMGELNIPSDPESLTFYTKPETCTFGESQVTRDSITINWDYPEGYYSKIIIRYGRVGKADDIYLKQIKYTDSSHPTSLTVGDLEPNIAYYFDILTYSRSDTENTSNNRAQGFFSTIE